MAASERRPYNHCPSRRKHEEEKYNEEAILVSFQTIEKETQKEDNEDIEENVARINIKQNLQGVEVF